MTQYVAFLNTVDPMGRTAPSLQHDREPDGLAALRPDRLRRAAPPRPPLLGRLAGMGRQALRLRQLPPLGPLHQLALQRQGAGQEREQRRDVQATAPTGCASRAKPRRGCTRCATRRRPARPRPASSSRARTSGSRPPTTTPTAAAPTPTGSTRPTPAYSARRRPTAPSRRSSTRPTATSPTPPRSRCRPSTPRRSRRPRLVPGHPDPEACTTSTPSGSPRTYESLRRQPRHGRPGAHHLALGHARPGRQRGRVDRHDHPAAVRRQGMAASGAASTAASPTRPSTSSGSRRSACSRRTTPSSPPPTPGSASASASRQPQAELRRPLGGAPLRPHRTEKRPAAWSGADQVKSYLSQPLVPPLIPPAFLFSADMGTRGVVFLTAMAMALAGATAPGACAAGGPRPGTLDPSFGRGGKVFAASPPGFARSEYLAAARAPDGSLILDLQREDGVVEYREIERRRPEASLDRSFGGDGRVRVGDGTRVGAASGRLHPRRDQRLRARAGVAPAARPERAQGSRLRQERLRPAAGLRRQSRLGRAGRRGPARRFTRSAPATE